jgi:copper resistance protein C
MNVRKSLNTATQTLAFLFATTATAFAHAHPKKVSPAPNSSGPAPKEISISFSEAIEPKFSFIQIADEAGKPVSTESSKPVAGDATALTLAVPKLNAGTYTVHWVNVSADGHRLEGRYKFTVQ